MINMAHKQRYLRLPLDSDLSVFDFEKQIFPYWHNLIFPPEGLPVPVTHRHHHEELELFCVTEGRMMASLNGEPFTMTPGDIFIANPFDLHEGSILRPERFADDYVILDLRHFGSCYGASAGAKLSGVLDGSLAFPRIIPHGTPGADRLASAIHAVCLAYRDCADATDPSAADCLAAARISELFSVLLSDFTPAPSAARPRLDSEFIHAVAEYLVAYYNSELSTAAICNALGYNVSYFCKRFKDSFGTTFTEYLNAYRIQIAIGKYRYSALPLSEIAARVGFNDYCYFSRVFRQRMGMSPTEFYGR
ncbi:MAG: helix-turn-helix domain-containing protein [Ruminococcaceae bacterium]|nr:helix-turn-helix domain-containing protein [Oscillospiraceae bacterium]